MAWNPSPKVAAARDIGKAFDRPMVIVIMIGADGVEYASWGKTQALCAETGKLADVAFNAVTKEKETPDEI